MPETPEFWYEKDIQQSPIKQKILDISSKLYSIGHQLNQSKKTTKQAPVPVICIGNATAGGGGKTPTAIAINKIITNHKIFDAPFFLSRGYGGNASKPRRISVHDTPSSVGDEPLLLVKHSNTIISKERHAGACLAHDLGADCVIMDDGLQNMGLHKDLSFLVVDGKKGFGNHKTIPAGPLREPLEEAFNKVHAVIIIGNDQAGIKSLIPAHLPIFEGSIQPKTRLNLDKKAKYIAFAGLAHPDKFFNTLREHNYNIVEEIPYPDHHPFNEQDIKNLMDLAQKYNAQIITTEKDHVRLSKTYQNMIKVLPVQLCWEDEKAVADFIKQEVETIRNATL